MTFRFFIQDNEKSSFRNLAEIYNELDISEKLKHDFNFARNNLNSFLDSNSHISINGVLTYRSIMEVIVFGGLSHANKNKKKLFDSWMSDPINGNFILNDFIYVLGTIYKVIKDVRDINNKCLEIIG